MLYTISQTFQDPHIHYPTDNLDLSFSDYIIKCKQIIEKYRIDLNHNNKKFIIEANAPFEYLPSHDINTSKTGALLIHGLLDSPFIMRDIAARLKSNGLLVRSLLLPGHGTVPGGLLNVTYKNWLQTLHYGINSLKKQVENIFLVGYSTGATLSIYQALQNPSQIAGLILLSPALKIHSFFDFATNWHKTISWIWPRAQWVNQTEEIDYVKYCSMPFNAAYQVYRLTQALQKINRTKKLLCPQFIVLSYEDKIIRSKSAIEYFQKNSHPTSELLLYHAKHIALQDSRMLLRKSTYPESNIINFSHIAIPVSPNNSHYGINGDYPLASHTNNNNHHIQYRELDSLSEIFYKSLYQLKWINSQQQRLTFNPDFEFMINKIINFVKNSS